MIFVTAELRDELAKNAAQILMVHASSQKIESQKDIRDDEIRKGISKTGFGRKPGTTKKLSTDPTILLSRLKTDYKEKTQIVEYTRKNAEGVKEVKYTPIGDRENIKEYVLKGVVT